jgi:cysteinyl-tRNA synthetase
MNIFNTLTQQKEPLFPQGDLVRMYVCGVTPYDTTHLGHAFTFIAYDVLARYLEFRGYTVRYVQNVTDIDDDILRRAREVGMNWKELGDRETARYLSDMQALNMRPFDVYARATKEISGMIMLIEELIAGGFAYVSEGSVYFSVARDPHFGALARAIGLDSYEAMLATANERGNYPDDRRKQDPLDFVLWQAQQPDEPAWPSPWGPGRPGWHIECSAMSMRYLGMQIDLHGGGYDLIFPHHTCEIAQVENVTHQAPFVRIWMHVAMVYLDGEKMSKSLGNLIRVGDLLRDYSSDAVRLMLLQHHYREPWHYDAAQPAAAEKLAAKLAMAADSVQSAPAGAVSHAAQGAEEAFIAAMEDDLDTPRAIDVLASLAGAILEERRQGHDDLVAQATLRRLGGVLGLALAGANEREKDDLEN